MAELALNLKKRSRAELDAEIERMAREQGVERFNFKEAFGEGKDVVTDDEIEDLLTMRREARRIEREAREREWLS